MSSILLFHQKPTISMRKMKSASSEIYQMMKAKDLHTYMSVVPTESDIKETCKQLGLKIIGKDKNAKVILKYPNQNKTHLSLGFYAN